MGTGEACPNDHICPVNPPRADLPRFVHAKKTPGKAQIYPKEHSRTSILAVRMGQCTQEIDVLPGNIPAPLGWLLLGMGYNSEWTIWSLSSAPLWSRPVHTTTGMPQTFLCDYGLSDWQKCFNVMEARGSLGILGQVAQMEGGKKEMAVVGLPNSRCRLEIF